MIKRPMLAAKATDEELQALFKRGHSFLLSPKIDGIRALVVNGQLVSRTMKPIRNYYTQSLFGRPELEGLDGELVVGNPWDKNLMQQTSSGVMSFNGHPDVRFYVFDMWNIKMGFTTRIENAHLQHRPLSLIHSLNHQPVNSYDELLEKESHYLSLGYEGVMLRHPNGPYKQNRSTLREAYLVKVKRFEDSEAVVEGYEFLQRNLNAAETDERGYTKRSHISANKVSDELIGSLVVRCPDTGQKFNIGSGFTEAQREEMFNQRHSLIGRVVKYKSFKNAGVKDAPRHPIFLGFRHEDDL